MSTSYELFLAIIYIAEMQEVVPSRVSGALWEAQVISLDEYRAIGELIDARKREKDASNALR